MSPMFSANDRSDLSGEQGWKLRFGSGFFVGFALAVAFFVGQRMAMNLTISTLGSEWKARCGAAKHSPRFDPPGCRGRVC